MFARLLSRLRPKPGPENTMARLPTHEEIGALAPRVFEFTSLEEWLRQWVAYRIQSDPKNQIQVPSGVAIYFSGSIGYYAALSPDGTVWINEDDWDPASGADQWRVALPLERLSLLAGAQQRYLPELAVLLPLRPIDAKSCVACDGSGRILGGAAACPTCGSMGWVP